MKLSDTGSFCVFFRSDKAQNVPGRGQTDICRNAVGRQTAPERKAGGNARRGGALHIALAVADVDRLARLAAHAAQAFEQRVGRRFVARRVLHADNSVEIAVQSERREAIAVLVMRA